MCKQPAQGVGSELARAREQRGLSLADIAARTKISIAALAAIERDEERDLPGGIFTRGFLRAYAREVGLDPGEVVRRYRETTSEGDPAPGEPLRDAAAAADPAVAGQLHVAEI